jgi:hypothetical protein
MEIMLCDVGDLSACMLGKADMCAFSGVAPDRKNGAAMLSRGCAGRDSKS